jgi:lipopolysaccharide export system protein LptC
MTTYRLLGIFAFVVLLVGAVALSGGQRESAAPVTVEEAMPDPGYSARKAHMVQTAADGHPLYTLDAAQVQQQPGQETVTLEQVQFAFRDDSGNEWTARANQGELSQNTGIVKLAGAVHVNGKLPGADEPADLTTEHLAFDTHAQLLTTADPVTLVMSGHKLDATGMIANLKESRVQLESAIHGTYLP